MSELDIGLSVALGIGLAAATGFRLFLPMLIKGPAPESGVSDVPLDLPDAPKGQFETRELPLVGPGEAPKGGAVGMTAPADPDQLPTVDTTATQPALRIAGMLRPRPVGMTPGWTAFEVFDVSASRFASCFAKSRFASLDWPYAVHGL